MRNLILGTGLFLALVPSCSATFNARACTTDADCGANVCELVSGQPVCVLPAKATLNIGMSAPITGPNQQLGTDMKLGVNLAFGAQNANGGIRGRQISLDFMDDEYQPALALTNAQTLADVQTTMNPPKCPSTDATFVTGQMPLSATALDRGPKGVLAFIGNVGTPTMTFTAPLAVETGTLFFGAFTGSSLILRDTSTGPCSKYIFNVRASYANETYATMEYFQLVKVPDYHHIISFDQNDTFGQAGYNGLVAAYTALVGPFDSTADMTNPIQRYRYTRNDETTVPPLALLAETYLANLLAGDTANHVVGVEMTDTYGPGADFITAIRQWQYANDMQQTQLSKATRLTLYFSNVSFVGPDALAARLVAAQTMMPLTTPSGATAHYTDNVSVSQVVPNYQSDSSDVVTAYRTAMAGPPAQTMSFTSLEGYIDGRIFVEGLLAHQGPFTPDSLISSFEGLPDLSLGVGAGSGFSPTNHNYSKTVWGTSIQSDGTFANLYYWTDGSALQTYQ